MVENINMCIHMHLIFERKNVQRKHFLSLSKLKYNAYKYIQNLHLICEVYFCTVSVHRYRIYLVQSNKV